MFKNVIGATLAILIIAGGLIALALGESGYKYFVWFPIIFMVIVFGVIIRNIFKE